VRDVTSGNFAFRVEVDLDEFAKSGAVVVAGRLGVAERFENRIGIEKFLLQWSSLDSVAVTQVLENVFSRLGFSGTRFT